MKASETMATAKPAGSDVVNPLVADWGDRKASDGGHGAAPERLVFEVGTADAGHSRKSRKSPYQSDVPFFSRVRDMCRRCARLNRAVARLTLYF